MNQQTTTLLQEGTIHHRAGRFAEAERIYRRILELEPNHADAWQLLGMIADRAGQFAAAIQHIQHAIALNPNNPIFYNNLGTVFEAHESYEEAIACMREAVRRRPGYTAAINNLGECYKAKGDVHRALEYYREALFHDPYFLQCRSNLLMVLNYDPDAVPRQIFAEHCRWGQLVRLNSPPPFTAWANSREAERPLRVGYVSPDFRKHAVARFFEPILQHHDRRQFAVYLYAEVPGIDDVGRRFQSLAQGWFSTVGHDAAEAAERVRADQIDILVDLAGHTRHNRLDVLALRPAPVQVTYLGYSNTTGLDTVQYRISDAVLDPPDERLPMTEEVVRTPSTFACFRPPADAPAVSPLPARRNGHVTFGSHHPTIKLNDHVLRLWKRVLDAVPTARLLLMRNQFKGRVAEDLRSRLASLGYPLDRVDIRCPTEHESSYLKLFDEIDVILDSFPFNSHTMTCEALWMGCPIVTLYGDRPTSRLSASVMTALELPEFIARSLDDYVAACARAAGDLGGLEQLRRGLRERMQTRLCDGATFTRQIESIYRQMWRRWCES